MTRLGRYTLVRELGRGGMGVVWEATDDAGRRLAVKAVRADLLDPVSARRFEDEGRALARVRHPGVVGVHALDVAPSGERLLVMDLVEGRELGELVRAGPLAPRAAAALVRDLARAVAALHAAGVIHRDLKPSNVLVRPDGAPVIVDFGLARAVDRGRLTATGEVVGTPAFMAPEQADGGGAQAPDPRTDVHALGAILFFLLVGRPPFDAATTIDTLFQVLQRDPVWPAPGPGGEGLAALGRRALAKRPEDRPPSAEALAADLDAWLAGARGPRGPRRARVVAVAAAAALLAGTAGALAWRARPPGGPGADGGPGPDGGPAAPPAGLPRPAGPAARDAEADARARGELEALRARVERRGPQGRRLLPDEVERLDAWLARHPDHPDAEAGRRLRRARAPVAVLGTFEGATLRAAPVPGTGDLVLAWHGAPARLDAALGLTPAGWSAGGRLYGVAVTPDGAEALFPAGRAGVVRLPLAGWATAAAARPLGDLGRQVPNVVAVAPDGRWAAVGCGGADVLRETSPGTVLRVDLGSGEATTLATLRNGVTALAIADGGRRVVVGSGRDPLANGLDERIAVFDAESGAELLNVISVRGTPEVAAVAPDGRTVFLGTAGQAIVVVDLSGPTPVPILDALLGRDPVPEWGSGLGSFSLSHGGAVLGLAVSPDGRTLVSASVRSQLVAAQGGEVRVWDLAARGERRPALTGFPEGTSPRGVAITADGRHALVGVARAHDARRAGTLTLEVWSLEE